MKLVPFLGLERGITAIIGSGGKTTLLRTLGQELPGRVILCTTTHIMPFAGLPLYTGGSEAELAGLLAEHPMVCVGRPGPEGKLTAPALSMEALGKAADYVLVEADGSRRLPIKAHASHEPVIPPESKKIICVVGASGFGRRIGETVHRPELFCRLTGAKEGDRLTPALAAGAIAREGLARLVFVNQVEKAEDWAGAEEFARTLEGTGISVTAGSLQRGVYRQLTE